MGPLHSGAAPFCVALVIVSYGKKRAELAPPLTFHAVGPRGVDLVLYGATCCGARGAAAFTSSGGEPNCCI